MICWYWASFVSKSLNCQLGFRLLVWWEAYSQGYISAKALIESYMILASTGRVIAIAGSMTADLAKGSDSVGSVFAVLDCYTRIEPEDSEGTDLKK